MVLDVELLLEEVLDLLCFPGLALPEAFEQFRLSIFVELRGLASPETRAQGLDAAVVPVAGPAIAGRFRPADMVGGLLDGVALIKVLDEAEAADDFLSCVSDSCLSSSSSER